MRPWVDGLPAFRAICDAVDSAHRSLWVTIAFLEESFEMPDGRGSLFDVLDAAAARGLDVRVIFWRSWHLEGERPDTHFPGTADQRRALAQRGSRFKARWDALPRDLCQHQKSWLVDAGTDHEVAFVGGINLDRGSLAEPGHLPREHGNTHDVYLELRGPAATDVHHNFVQRWNQASERSSRDGVWPQVEDCDDLAFPDRVSSPRGSVPVQITRTVRRGTYAATPPSPGGPDFDVGPGESSVFDQYLAALGAARSSIYIEDQLIASPRIIAALDDALSRGVEVVFLVPGDAHPAFAEARRDPQLAALFEPLHALARFENFCLAGIGSHAGPGRVHDIYVHAKIALVDDAWATVGSTNVADRSFRGDTELNASFWHEPSVRALRVELLSEHLAHDTSRLDDAKALRLYADTARKNSTLRARGEAMQGLAFEIDPVRYGH